MNTVFVTKYALSKGIIEMRVIKVHNEKLITVGPLGTDSKTSGFDTYLYGEGKEWHRTLESAVERAEAMRKAKLISLDKQIKRLRSMDFSRDTR